MKLNVAVSSEQAKMKRRTMQRRYRVKTKERYKALIYVVHRYPVCCMLGDSGPCCRLLFKNALNRIWLSKNWHVNRRWGSNSCGMEILSSLAQCHEKQSWTNLYSRCERIYLRLRKVLSINTLQKLLQNDGHQHPQPPHPAEVKGSWRKRAQNTKTSATRQIWQMVEINTVLWFCRACSLFGCQRCVGFPFLSPLLFTCS